MKSPTHPALRADSLPPLPAYRLTDVAAVYGWQRHAIRQAKRQGLKIVRFGSTSYVTARALEAFFAGLEDNDRKQADDAAGGKASKEGEPVEELPI